MKKKQFYININKIKDFKPLKHNSKYLVSETFNKEFIEKFDEFAKPIKVHHFKLAVKLLIEKNYIVFYKLKNNSEEGDGAYFNSLTSKIYINIPSFFRKYKQNAVGAVDVLIHEFAHFAAMMKPHKFYKIFKHLLVAFYVIVFKEILHYAFMQRIVKEEFELFKKKIIEDIIAKADSIIDIFDEFTYRRIHNIILKYNISLVYEQAISFFITIFNVFMGTATTIPPFFSSPNSIYMNKRTLITIVKKMDHFHNLLSNLKDEQRELTYAGYPAQEPLAPSEIISLQAQRSGLVKQKLLKLVYDIAKELPHAEM